MYSGNYLNVDAMFFQRLILFLLASNLHLSHVQSSCGYMTRLFEDTYMGVALSTCAASYNATSHTGSSNMYLCDGDSDDNVRYLEWDGSTECSGTPTTNSTVSMSSLGISSIVCGTQTANCSITKREYYNEVPFDTNQTMCNSSDVLSYEETPIAAGFCIEDYGGASMGAVCEESKPMWYLYASSNCNGSGTIMHNGLNDPSDCTCAGSGECSLDVLTASSCNSSEPTQSPTSNPTASTTMDDSSVTTKAQMDQDKSQNIQVSVLVVVTAMALCVAAVTFGI
jgi:hypothetical protein